MATAESTTHTVIPQSPLMSVIEFDGQLRHTMQYFHRQYIENSEVGKGKYRRFSDFARAARSMENYPLHCAQGDIAEVEWNTTKAAGKPLVLSLLKPLFQANAYNPIVLLNAAAQVSLAYLLDDAISKQMSVTASTLVARQEVPLSLDPSSSMQTLIIEQMLALSKTQDAQAHRLEVLEKRHEATQALVQLALEATHRMTIEDFVLRNGLLHQFPEVLWRDMGKRLGAYCAAYNLSVMKVVVHGKSWSEENAYPLQAFEWLRRHPTVTPQMPLTASRHA